MGTHFVKKVHCLIIIVALCSAIALSSACTAQPLPPDAEASPAEITDATVVSADDVEHSGEISPDDAPSPFVFVAHAGGFAEGYAESNSAEAMQNSAQRGYTLIELDIIKTSDGRFALAHDWEYMSNRVPLTPNESVTAAEFLQYKWFGNLTTVMLDYLFDGFLDKFPNVRIVTDTKLGDYSSLEYIAETYPDYIDRFIPQAYAFEDCEMLRALGFGDIIVTVYLMSLDYKASPSLIAERALECGVYAMTIPLELIDSDGYAENLRTGEIRYFVHTVNSVEQAEWLSTLGFYGIYTDILMAGVQNATEVIDDDDFYAAEAVRFNQAIATFSDATREMLSEFIVCIAGSELVIRHGTAEMLDASTMISCFTLDGVFFLPLRKMAEYLDAGTVNGTMNGSISIEYGNTVIEFTVGGTEMIRRINDTDEIIAMPAAATIYRNVCFVPQAVFEALGLRVTANGDVAVISGSDSQYSEEALRALAERIGELLTM